jgi:predicted ferric reductase
MATIIRGTLWFGLYVFLALLPLGTAIAANPNRTDPPLLLGLAIGAGFVGLSLMALEFALISRVTPAAGAFGEDSLQLFHNLMGVVALGLVLAHPILLVIYGYPATCWLNPFSGCANTATITASLALYVLLALIITSIWRKPLKIRYEIWFVIHGLFALFVVLAAQIHIFVMGRYTSTPLMKTVWLAYTVLIIYLIVWYRIIKPLINWNHKWEVVENREERGDSRTLVLKPVGHPGFSFLPGQFSWLKGGRMPIGPGAHPISMSSNGDMPEDGIVTFTIKNLGDWSGQTVPAMRPGDTLWVDGPYGVFSMDREQAMGYVFIGGGVGITPLYAMLQTMASREDVRPVVLFYGGQDEESLTFREELDALSEQMMNLKVVYVLSDPEEGWSGETGFITGQIMQRYLPQQYKRFMFMICGPKALMDAMEQAIPDLGVPWEHVLTERFDMA